MGPDGRMAQVPPRVPFERADSIVSKGSKTGATYSRPGLSHTVVSSFQLLGNTTYLLAIPRLSDFNVGVWSS